MDDDALIHSLTAKVRLLEDLVIGLRHQVRADRDLIEQAMAAEEILRRAAAAPRAHPHLRVVRPAVPGAEAASGHAQASRGTMRP